jgi:hypothetical protein
VYVNPQNPAESVLYRNLRWEMMLLFSGMGVLFGSVGIGIFTASLVTWMRGAASGKINPDAERPWESRADWASGRIGPSDAVRAAVPATSAVAAWWVLMSVPIVVTFPLALEYSDTRWSWLLLAIPAIAVLIIGCAIYLAIRRRRFGESVFEMASVPGVVGGPLTGVIRIPKVFEPKNGFRIRLSCMEQGRNHKGEREHERTIWQDESFVAKAMADGTSGIAVPVLMAIPYKSRPTSVSESKTPIRWFLELFAELPGVNYKTEFEVPVFKTAESRADFQLDPALTADYTSPPNNDLFLREAGIIKEPASYGGVRLIFPAGRSVVSSLVATTAAVAFCGGAWLMYQNDLMILFPIVFGFVGVLFAMVAIDSWLYRSVVEASTRGLSIRGGVLGLGRTRTYRPDEIRQFYSKQSMSSGRHVWSTISVETQNGESRTIGKNIYSKLAEQAVIDELNAALGREVPLSYEQQKVQRQQRL